MIHKQKKKKRTNSTARRSFSFHIVAWFSFRYDFYDSEIVFRCSMQMYSFPVNDRFGKIILNGYFNPPFFITTAAIESFQKAILSVFISNYLLCHLILPDKNHHKQLFFPYHQPSVLSAEPFGLSSEWTHTFHVRFRRFLP